MSGDDGAPLSSTATAGHGPQAEERTDRLNCFNEDLVWIIDRLVMRSGGSFGIISRHIHGERGAAVLARIGADAPSAPDSFFEALASFAAPLISTGRRRRDDEADVRQAAWSPGAAGEPLSGYRVLQLAFVPTQNVTLVASVGRPDGAAPFTATEELVAAKLYPVLARYVRLWWLHRMERRRANSLSAALDLSDVGVILLDRRASLLFANTRAAALLAREDGLQRNDRLIAATEPHDDFRFQAAVQRALHCNLAEVAESEDRFNGLIMTLRRGGRQRALIATVMNLEHAAVDPRDPAVIIYVFDPEQNVEQMLAPVCRLYKLTAAESRLVHHLVNGLRIAQAAERMQVQPDTARAYLKQVFVKTMINRQVDLVRLMYASMTRTNAKIDLALL